MDIRTTFMVSKVSKSYRKFSSWMVITEKVFILQYFCEKTYHKGQKKSMNCILQNIYYLIKKQWNPFVLSTFVYFLFLRIWRWFFSPNFRDDFDRLLISQNEFLKKIHNPSWRGGCQNKAAINVKNLDHLSLRDMQDGVV